MPDDSSRVFVPEPMWVHLQHARWLMDPCRLRDSIDKAIGFKFDTTEVPGVTPMPVCLKVENYDR